VFDMVWRGRPVQARLAEFAAADQRAGHCLQPDRVPAGAGALSGFAGGSRRDLAAGLNWL
jgi:hypothetical protein